MRHKGDRRYVCACLSYLSWANFRTIRQREVIEQREERRLM
jgi:hypothetical protein